MFFILFYVLTIQKYNILYIKANSTVILLFVRDVLVTI